MPKAAGAGGPRTLPLLSVLCATAAFQVGAALAKGLFPAVGPTGAAALRLTFAALLLLALHRPWRAWPANAPRLPLLGLGLSLGGVMLLFYLGLTRAPLAIVISLQFLGPLAIALFDSRRPIDLLWAGLAGFGVWSIVDVTHATTGQDWLGILCGLGAAACWAGYILFGRVASRDYGRSAPALGLAIAALAVLPFGWAQAGLALFALEVLPLALLVALTATAIPLSLELYALPRLPPRLFAVFTSLEPACGVLFGFLMLHERLSGGQLAGVVSVVLAAAGSTWTSRR